MKNSHRSHAASPPSSRTDGFALVVVLAVLVLLVVLAIGFLSRSISERSSAAGFNSLVFARQFAESAVTLVQAQINMATLQGQNVAWASQPGMIRTFGNDGSLKEAFKLYSASDMILTGAVDPGAETAKMVGWNDSPAIWTDLNAPVIVKFNGSDQKTYPILDPAAIDSNPSETVASSGAINQFTINSSAPTTATQKAPMPVEWLYILKDGSFQSPSGSGTTATVPAASATNPIVGRVAFWTDDETSKVNINTASEGSYWDTPRVYTDFDRDLASYQPTKNEFQRYPGHPAMTSLRAALPSPASGLTFTDIYGLAPRIQSGGSNVQSTDGTKTSASKSVSSGVQPVSLDGDRLYASVNELLFNEAREDQNLTKTDVETAQFFLTASSRAPEVNLFNLPRVAMWPLHAINDNAHRNATDRLLAFVASLDGNPYYFQRGNKDSNSDDYTNIQRNQELYAYLQRLSGRSIPGFGGTFLSKYGTDRDQILTEMFDYIRMTNLRDTTVSNPYGGDTTASQSQTKGNGQVVPIEIGATRGFGRFPVVTEATIFFVGVGQGENTSTPATDRAPVDSRQRQAPNAATYDPATQAPDTIQIQAFVTLQFFVPAMGWSDYEPNFTVQIEGLGGFKVDGTNLGFANSGSVYIDNQNSIHNSRALGGVVDFRTMLYQKDFSSTVANKRFPFYSKILSISRMASSMIFTGGPIEVKVFSGDSTGAQNLVQTVNIDFYNTPTTTPVPRLAKEGYRLIGVPGVQNYVNDTTLADRFDISSQGNLPQIDSSTDVVRSMVLANGDARLAIPSIAPASTFVTHPNSNSTTRVAHGLVTGAPYTWFVGASQGKLVKDLAYGSRADPRVPTNINGAFVGGGTSGIPGDWDTGISFFADGPYINKPDEGNIFGAVPYYDSSEKFNSVTETFFTPNRQIPSPGMFGSLSTGVLSARPWQTLLFRPDPSGLHPGSKGRKGDGTVLANAPADHLWMDLFWMPVVEPYPISEPMSTAGKINMNFQIMPFTYISRDSGLRAVMASERIMTLENADANRYKRAADKDAVLDHNPRKGLNLSRTDGTLRQFVERFDSGDIFRSATEICDIFLVPEDQSWTSDADGEAYWNNHLLNGDNVRERPYTNIYPRLTTKSNTYTVHYKVQSLKNPPSVAPNTWNENKGIVQAEYRGSTTVERYVDLDSVDIDFATSTGTSDTLNHFYKWRVLAKRQFAP